MAQQSSHPGAPGEHDQGYFHRGGEERKLGRDYDRNIISSPYYDKPDEPRPDLPDARDAADAPHGDAGAARAQTAGRDLGSGDSEGQ